MVKGKKVFEFTAINKYTPIHKLGIIDSIRTLMSELLKNTEDELDLNGDVNKEYLTLKANCFDLLYRSTAPIRNGTRRSVRVKVSSKFKPVIQDVINSDMLKKYYYIRVRYPAETIKDTFFYTVDVFAK